MTAGKDVVIQAPPATASGLTPTPGSLVPTPARLNVPMAGVQIMWPIPHMKALIVALYNAAGDEFPFRVNLGLECLSHLSAADVAELQELMGL